MILENQTPFPAEIFRGVIDEQRLFASVAARVTYVFRDGQWIPAEEQTWPVSAGPWDCPYGTMAGDELFYRGGVDLFVFGAARSLNAEPVSFLEVKIQIGETFSHHLRVFGDRKWVKKDGRLVPSDPEPFTVMPLDLSRAYGGKDVWDELPIPYPPNPEGKGFYISEESAEGNPLPNIEDPKHPIVQWKDQPEPKGVGLRPPNFGPSVDRFTTFDEQSGILSRIDPRFFNAAFPDMIAERIQPGDPVRIEGMSHSGPISFVLPDLPLCVELTFGNETHVKKLPIDQVGIEVDHARMFISYRYPFRYKLVPLQSRACRLFLNDGAISS